ncbi:MAG: hypothetical protein WCG95_07935 [bacterium]
MIDFFDRIYSKADSNYFIVNKLKLYSVIRFFIRLFVNISIPLWYKFTRTPKLANRKYSNKRVIVSLTSFPTRINRVWLVSESMLRQKYQPSAIILWLSKEQFKSKKELPKSLLGLEKNGLQIRLCEEDLKSHKKYYYALKEFTDDLILTVDDDIFYPTTLVKDLIELNNNFPKSICCHRACLIQKTDNYILPYTDWKDLKTFNGPNTQIFQTSGGGTLFPPNSLYKDVLNENLIRRLCFNADDIWLNMMSRLNSTTLVKSNYYSACIPILFRNDIKLASLNVENYENDIQLDRIRNYYLQVNGKDIFENIV